MLDAVSRVLEVVSTSGRYIVSSPPRGVARAVDARDRHGGHVHSLHCRVSPHFPDGPLDTPELGFSSENLVEGSAAGEGPESETEAGRLCPRCSAAPRGQRTSLSGSHPRPVSNLWPRRPICPRPAQHLRAHRRLRRTRPEVERHLFPVQGSRPSNIYAALSIEHNQYC